MSGEFNKKTYDTCAFQQRVANSTSIHDHLTYRGKYVNGNKCHIPQQKYINLVDTETELKNQGRLASKCNMFQYHPFCKTRTSACANNTCLSTFSKLVPINDEPRVCPDAERLLWFNSGLIKPLNPGFFSPEMSICGSKRGNLPRKCSTNPYIRMKY